MPIVDAATFVTKTFDYLVVGGGTCGLSLAKRISDDENVSVGVIEAGVKTESPKVLIPGMIGSSLGDPELDWMPIAEPIPKADNKVIMTSHGKVLGGTSALNFHAYQRPCASDIDVWEELGNPGWNYKDFEQRLRKLDKWHPPPREIVEKYYGNDDPENRGTDGPLKTTSYSYWSNLVPLWFETVKSLGVEVRTKPATDSTMGAYTASVAIDPEKRTRFYGVPAFYEPYSTRQNYTILTGAHVTRVIFEDQPDANRNIVATGVELDIQGTKYIARAKRDVILSSGAFNSPAILEHSGIGGKEILETLGIKVLVDLPGVGENLQDHPNVSAITHATDDCMTLDAMLTDPEYATAQMNLYTESLQGPMTSAPGVVAMLNIRQLGIPQKEFDEMMSALDADLAKSEFKDGPWKKTHEAQRRLLEREDVPQMEFLCFPSRHLSAPEPGKKYYSIVCALTRPWSRGKVHIASKDELLAPKIHLGYLDTPGDFENRILRAALRYAMKTMRTEPLKSVTLDMVAPPENATNEQLDARIKESLMCFWHFSGTNAMLPREENGVVDPSLKVYGTANLRVADASIMPLLIATHPMATLYATGHKLAEILEAERKAR